MKGVNSLSLNQATMVEAVQEYFDKRLTSSAGKQTVLSVTAESTSYGPSKYTVTVEEKTT